MSEAPGDSEYTEFKPRYWRVVLVETWSLAVTLAVAAVALYLLGILDAEWLRITVAIGLIGTLLGGVFRRNSRVVAIGESWIAGPADGFGDRETIRFDSIDPAGTGFRGRSLRVRSASGRKIKVKLAWYAPEDVEEMRRLLRDRWG